MSLPTYKEGNACPKCGNRIASTMYFQGFLGIDGKHSGECLKRVCERCEYRWNDACLDEKGEDDVR